MITLYKYRPFNDHLRPVIIAQKIWFPARAKLNDPEDLLLNLINDVDADTYRQYLLKRAEVESWSGKLLKYNLKKAFAKRGDLTSAARRKIAQSQTLLQKHFDSLGILSLSELEDSPVLWERYGDQEKGVCMVFKLELSEHLLKVVYETPRPQPRLSTLLLSADADKELIRVLNTKTTKWSDESEWRYFVRNGNTEFEFLGVVETIRLGKKMPDANRQTVVEWAKAAGRTIHVVPQPDVA
jgi:hypothetical protein